MRGEWPLMGRDGDLAAIQSALDDPASRGVALVGAQGIGKSRLAREVQRRTSGIWATATLAARSIPFGALAHLLADDQATLPSDDPLDLLRRAEAVVNRTAPTGRPTIVVDDAHLLDDLSATFLHHLALQRFATVVVAVRSGAVPPDPITALWKDGLVERIDVAPLSWAACAELLEAVLDGHLDPISFHRIWQTTGGNPRFLREVVHAASGDGALSRRRGLWHWDGVLVAGDRLMELVRARLAMEDPRCHEVLELVACGEPLAVRLAEDLVGRRSLELAERAGFLVRATDGDDVVLRFVHPLYRDVLKSTMPVSRMRENCEQLAKALLDRGTDRTTDLVRVAVWQLEAGTPSHRRGVSFVAAARWAVLHDDPRLAERLARAALDTERPDAVAVLADALEKQGQHAEVVQLLQHLSADDDPAALTMARASNRYWADQRSTDPTDPTGTIASSPSDAAPDPSGGEVPAAEAWILFFESRLPACVEIARSVLDQPGSTLRARTWAATAGTAALGLQGRSDEALLVAELGGTAAESLGPAHPWGRPEILWARVLALVTAGRLAEARLLLVPDRDVSDGSPQLVGMGAGFRGLVARMQGRVAAAVTSLHEAVGLLDRADMYRFVRLWLAELAGALAVRGDPAAAREVFDEAVSRDTSANRVFDPWIALDGAWVCAAEGRLSESVDLTLQAADLAHDLGQRAFEVLAAFDVARLGRPELVEDRLAALVPVVDGDLAPTCRDATRALVRRDAAALADCSHRFEKLGQDLVAAEAANAVHVLLRADRAPTPAAHAAERFRRLRRRCPDAATPLLGLVSEHLALTYREREIAALAAAGRSSPDIARLLHISARTVDNHLGAAYTKLGIAGRSGLATVFGTATDR